MDELFKGRHFDREIIVLCVRWYLRYKLSFRDLVEMMVERGLSLAHTTIMRWIQHYAPEFEKRWNRFARPAGRSWRVDETYVKIKGRWTYLYRAVDKEGRTVDFLLRAKRDVAAAKAFFRLAFRRQGRLPLKITLDGYQASHRAAKEALDEHPEGNQCKIRSSKYLNNLIEQDHRSVKLRLGPMLGLKHFRQAATTIAGIELMHRIRKGQFKLGRLGTKGNTAPKIWNAVLGCVIQRNFPAPAWLDLKTFAPQPEHVVDVVTTEALTSRDPVEALRATCAWILHATDNDLLIAFFRLCIAEAAKLPAVSSTFVRMNDRLEG